MATIRLQETTTATPEQLTAAVTDFGPGRSAIFGRSADGYLQVHSKDATHADVTEGSAGVWERLEYDWSEPNRITMKTIDSNTWGRNSGHTYTFTPLENGMTRVDAVVVREGKNLKGRAIEGLLALAGKRVLAKGFAQTVQAIEARSARAV